MNDHPRIKDDRPICLVGPMGAGKSTVGRRLAERLGRRFVDSDEHIEQSAGVGIPQIFEHEGEAGFRRREAAAIATLTAQADLVIATGGGAVLDPDNRAALAGGATTVYLTAEVMTQVERTRDSDRPLLRRADPEQRLGELLAQREPLYRQAARIEVRTDGRSVTAVVEEITRRLGEPDSDERS